jgi:CheY-like chemotaxis protein
VTALVIDSDAFTRSLVTQMLRGFGLDAISTCETGTQGIAHLQNNYADLCIVEGVLPDMPSTEFISWLRRQDKAMRFIPVMVLTGYTQMGIVAAARDGGANSVVKKPVSPQALFDRINWMAKVSRPFIETGTFIGPDRRIRNDTPPDGIYKRETDDKSDRDRAAPVELQNRIAQAFPQEQ